MAWWSRPFTGHRAQTRRSRLCRSCFTAARSSGYRRAGCSAPATPAAARFTALPERSRSDGGAHDHRRGHSDLLWPRHEGQHRQDGRLHPRSGQAQRGRGPAVGAVPGHLLPDAAGPEMVRNRLSCRGASLRARPPEPRRGAQGRHPHLVLREGWPALLQQRRSRRRRWQSARRLPQEPHPRRARLSGKILLSARRHRLKAWTTKAGVIGVGICWDQWYPESARAMVLQGADLLLYPTAIGSEPYDPSLDTHRQWQRVMQGQAVANAVPVVAANRIGVEENDGTTQSYYGRSFIADHLGELVASFGETEEGVLVHRFDLDEIAEYRAEWGFFRDRRTDLYAKSIV